MLFSELASITNGRIIHLAGDVEVDKITIDSRKILDRPAEIFVAINGPRNDGHRFISQAHQMGIRNFIVEDKNIHVPNANVLLVDSAVKALQQIAGAHRRKYSYPVVGITGSNGKTTVKEWLAELLSAEMKVVKSPKSFNSQVGVPLSVLEMSNHDVAIFEAGISQINEMGNLADVINPTIGIFTNIGEAHGEGFSSLEEKIAEKAKLFGSAERIICRHDHRQVQHYLKENFGDRVVSWSCSNPEADYFFKAKNQTYHLRDSALVFSLPISNNNQIENALHAILVAHILGVSDQSISDTSAQFRALPMRLELKKAVNGSYLIDDSYNNDLVGLEVALDFMNQQNPHQKRAVILSEILQSSLPDNELYARVKQLFRAKGVDRFFVVGHRISNYFEQHAFGTTEQFLANMPVFENETILVKGARSFAFEKIVARLEDQSHGTVLEVNFEALRNNLNAYRQLLKPPTKLMVMVKAFAYGAGLSEIASFLQHERVDYLGAAYLDEAVHLRKKGITVPIMIMNPEEIQFELFERFDLEAEIFNKSNLLRLINSQCEIGIHLKLETGMNRLGFSEEELEEVLPILANNKLKVKGVFTHFSSSDNPEEDAYTHEQASAFLKMYEKIVRTLGYSPLRHAVNSPGMVRFPEYHFDMTRLGIGLHGFDPTHKLSLQGVSKLISHISQIKHLKAGQTVGYNRNGKLERDTELAIIPIGYADGYLRVFGNGKGRMNIKEQLAPTVGNICMDMTMVDITGLNVQEGDVVEVFGAKPTIEDLASWSDTIPYEILTTISQRVKRVYVSE
jgi:alanine racemase